MELVRLSNGSEEVEALVTATMTSLKDLFTNQPIVFYELVMKCRDQNHRFFGGSGEDLKALGLIQGDGGVHDSIRNIVLSSVKGDRLEMKLGSPLASPAEKTDLPA